MKNKANKILFRKNELINKQKEELIEANTTKDTIFSIIGHDLRGPIGNLQSLLEILTNKFNTLDKKNIEKYLRLSQNSASSTFNLLENLLYWANYQRGKMAFEPENFVLNEIIKTNINLLLGISRTKSLQISSDVDDSLTVFADRNMISTVFRNLLSNAIKFTGESGKINISVQNINSSNVEISVSDTGIGIEEEDLTKIFNQRETKTKPGTNNEVGLGIGLLLSKK